MKELNLHKFKAEIKPLTAEETTGGGRFTTEAATIMRSAELRFREDVLGYNRDL